MHTVRETKQQPTLPDTPCYHLKTHGGLGDNIWLYKVLCNLDHPLFISVSSEGRHRPRRSGQLLDHLPRVIGWRYDDTTFMPYGDWPRPNEPCSAIDTTWRELDFKLNTETPYPLECNRWLEGGRRIEQWLPDLPTTHHFDFVKPKPPNIKFKYPYVIFHLAGWSDISTDIWCNGIRLFKGLAHVYIVGGSYDYRPRAVASRFKDADATLLEDLDWSDLYALIEDAEYVFGHASGFTAIADVLSKKGAIANPHCVRGLVGTWNDNKNEDLLYLATPADFETSIYAAHRIMSKDMNFTWPPEAVRGTKLTAKESSDPASAVRSSTSATLPRSMIIACAGEHPEWLGSAALDGIYSCGNVVDSVTIINCSPAVVAGIYRESGRCSHKPAISFLQTVDNNALRGTGVDMIVIYADGEPSAGYGLACALWTKLNARGTIMIGGPSAKVVCAAVAASLRVEAGVVNNATDWFFLHKRI